MTDLSNIAKHSLALPRVQKTHFFGQHLNSGTIIGPGLIDDFELGWAQRFMQARRMRKQCFTADGVYIALHHDDAIGAEVVGVAKDPQFERLIFVAGARWSTDPESQQRVWHAVNNRYLQALVAYQENSNVLGGSEATEPLNETFLAMVATVGAPGPYWTVDRQVRFARAAGLGRYEGFVESRVRRIMRDKPPAAEGTT